MKKTDLKVIKDLNIEDLIAKAAIFRKEVADLHLAVSDKGSKAKDLKLPIKKRKELAQVLTVLRQKQIITELESKNSEEKVVPDNSTVKPVEKKKGRTELSKKK